MPEKKYRIAIFASGSGSNAEVIARYFAGHQSIEIVLILSNNEKAFVLQRAKTLDIPSKIFTKEEFKHGEIVLHWLQEYQVTHVVLAGFLLLIPQYLITAYKEKIVNIHPALLPKFGGKGMYGMKVHQAVREAAETETGITIHIVNERYDDGEILFQGRCSIQSSDTPEQIAACVQKLEYEHYPRVIERWIMTGR